MGTTRGEWRSVSTMPGVQCVMMAGTEETPKSSADSWALTQWVCPHLLPFFTLCGVYNTVAIYIYFMYIV